LEAYQAGPWTIDRRTRGTLHIPTAAVSVVGTIQPGVLKRLLTAEFYESGLAARLLCIAPPRRRKRWTDRTVPPDVSNRYADVVRRLLTLREGEPQYVGIDRAAQGVWHDWYDRFAERQEAASGPMAAALAKIEAVAVRVALVFSLVRWADGEPAGPIGVQDIENGTGLADWYANETERVHGLLSETEGERERHGLVGWIKARGGSVTPRQLQMTLRAYREPGTAEAALDELASLDLGEWEYEPTGARGGRQKRHFRVGRQHNRDSEAVATGNVGVGSVGTFQTDNSQEPVTFSQVGKNSQGSKNRFNTTCQLPTVNTSIDGIGKSQGCVGATSEMCSDSEQPPELLFDETGEVIGWEAIG